MTLLIILACFLAGGVGLSWAYYNYNYLKDFPISGDFMMGDEEQATLDSNNPSIVDIGLIIHEAAKEFIVAEYTICSVFVVLMGFIVFICVDEMTQFYTTFAFLLGAVTSMFCGAFGMQIATYSNYRTTLAAKVSVGHAFRTAFKAGTVMGFTLVSISIIVLVTLIMAFKTIMGLEDQSMSQNYYERLFESVAGFGLGGSTVALFARVGGGIFTKAADLGSDLVGKLEIGLPEDSPKNPATIADNVGDNVGDVAGMSADLFGSFAESTCAALVIGGNSILSEQKVVFFQDRIFLLLIPAMGVLVCILVSALITEGPEITSAGQVESSLKKQLVFSTLGLLPALWMISAFSFNVFLFRSNSGEISSKSRNDIFICTSGGLVAGLIIGYFTQIMTSFTYRPVRELAESCRTGPATNIIYGLSLGYLSTIVPVLVLSTVCFFSHITLGFYGVSLAALGMLSNLPICLAIDGYGPISDNAGGIAEMTEQSEEVRERTDVLDAAGNTTAAIGKGFAIGSATLVGFALYGAFLHSAYTYGSLKYGQVSFDDPYIFTFLLVGAMIPYAFSALTMKSVGKAALGMINEVRRQIREDPGILEGTSQPNYKACVRMSTKASLKEMILPGLLVTLSPFCLGYLFGAKALLGFLPGAIVSGVQMAVSASNTGGAWDNAKKYVEAGLMIENGEVVRKGSEIHKAAVIGDTVGDPLKDTSGPSLNILIKLMAILSLVFCKYFSKSG